jgi:hypothetical protein
MMGVLEKAGCAAEDRPKTQTIGSADMDDGDDWKGSRMGQE